MFTCAENNFLNGKARAMKNIYQSFEKNIRISKKH